MPSITNKTKKPLAVKLPGGKTLRLGPGKVGQIGTNAVDHPAVKALLEAGEVEIGGLETGGDGTGGGNPSKAKGPGHQGGGGIRHFGDR